MKLIVGLGNPGPQYELTRHNAGFILIDLIADHYSMCWEKKDKFYGDSAKGMVLGNQAILLKPQTYMNLSGKSVAQCLRFFKISPSDTIVLHDEIDLEFGKVKSRLDGGHGGHNGIRSIISEIGSDKFARIKLGVGRPADRSIDVSSWVLGPMSDDELVFLQKSMLSEVLVRLKNILEVNTAKNS